MIIDELNKKIEDIESLAKEQSSSLESRVENLQEGVLMVADTVDTIPELIDEKVSQVKETFISEVGKLKEVVKKVKAQKGDNGIDGLDGKDGKDGKDGSSDTPEQVAEKLNQTENAVDWKVLKDFDSLVNQDTLKKSLQTLENQTRYLIQRQSTTTPSGDSVWGGITGTLSAQTDLQNALDTKIETVLVDGVTIVGDGVTTPLSATNQSSGRYVISGGASWSGTGLVYDVSVITYVFDGVFTQTAIPEQVTLAASDPTDNRIDALVVDADGNVSVITGTPGNPATTPIVSETFLLVQYFVVVAGSTEPPQTFESIYLDNTEWTTSTYQTAGSAVGTTNFASTNAPKQGTVCIENNGQDRRTGNRFIRSAPMNLNDYDLLSIWVRLPATVATNKQMNVAFYNGAGTLVGNIINLFTYGLQRNLNDQWQLVVIPTAAFNTTVDIQRFQAILAGGTLTPVDWDLDFITLSEGSSPVINESTIKISEEGTLVGSTSDINFVGLTADVDTLNNRIDVSLSGGLGEVAYFDETTGTITSDGGFIRTADLTLMAAESLDENSTWGVAITEGNLLPGLNGTTIVNIFDDGVDDITQILFVGDSASERQLISTIIDNNSGALSTQTQKIDEIAISVLDSSSITSGITLDTTSIGIGHRDVVTERNSVIDFSNISLRLEFRDLVPQAFSSRVVLDEDDSYLGYIVTGVADNRFVAYPDKAYAQSVDLVTNTEAGLYLDANDTLGATLSFTDGVSTTQHFIALNNGGIMMDAPSAVYVITPETTIDSQIAYIGDASYAGNGTIITVNDSSSVVTITNNLELSGIPAYDDDAAAGTAGLTAGMVYQTTGSGSAPLNAAGIVMLKQ